MRLVIAFVIGITSLAGSGCAHRPHHTLHVAAAAVGDLVVATARAIEEDAQLSTPVVVAAPAPVTCTVVGQLEGRDEGGSYVRAAEQVKAAARAAGVRTIAFGRHTRPTPTTVIVPATLLACQRL